MNKMYSYTILKSYAYCKHVYSYSKKNFMAFLNISNMQCELKTRNEGHELSHISKLPGVSVYCCT